MKFKSLHSIIFPISNNILFFIQNFEFKIQNSCFIFLFLVVAYAKTGIFSPIPIHAQHFESSNYIIEWGNFNMTSGKKTSTNYSLTDTVGQNAPGQYNSNGFIVKSGFQYIYDINNQFTFSISDLDLNLGSLVPGVATTATNIITVTSPAGHGYLITAQQNHPLINAYGTTIPDTACNTATPCTTSLSNVWTNTTDYGFGFNALGINSSGTVNNVGTSGYFTNNTYFRPFSSSPNTPQVFMSHDAPIKDHRALITYKTIISSFQQAGRYQNLITFTATPKY